MILITREEAEALPGALATISPGAEVIVVDADSRDGTAEIAARSGARVLTQDQRPIVESGGNFDLARNQGAAAAGGDWLLFLDADERLTEASCRELAGAMRSPGEMVAFEMPRVNLFWGRPVRLLGEDHQLRLVRRGAGRFAGPGLHRRMQVDGPIGRLREPLVHDNVRSWRDVERRFRRDVPIEARALGRRPSLGETLTAPMHLFRFYYLRNRAWRDGLRGLLVCLAYAAYHGHLLWRARRDRDA